MHISHQLAKNLRKNSTNAEKILWEMVRNKRLENKKFYRQYPIKFQYEENERFFIADFYCYSSKLIIELDGKIHEQQKDYDQLRDYIISKIGIKVLRLKNDEIEYDIDVTLNKIRKFL